MKPFQPDGSFHPIAQGDGLRRSAIRGAGVTIFSQGLSFLVQTASIIVLARLLTPADFGIVTMVTTFSLVFCSFGLNGFTEAILQQEEVSNSLASNLFWVNVGISILLTVIFIAIGPLLARFYHNALVTQVAAGMSLTIFVGSLGWIHLALLSRAMQFRTVSTINIAARLISVVISIVLAALGWGYWALVVGQVANGTVTALGAWGMCRWVPQLPNREGGTGSAIKFATNVYLHYAFSYVTRNTDNLLVGWRFGAQSLGFYKRAYDLFVLPESQLISPISAVVVSTLSRVNRDRAQYQRYFLSGLTVLAFVGMGIGIDITLVGRDVIRFLLGPGWDEAGRIFALFGPGIGVMLLYSTHGWIHLSSGRPGRWFRWGVYEFLFTVGLFVLALHWGPPGIALAWTISYFILFFPAIWYAGNPIQLPMISVVAAVWKFFLASAAAGFATHALLQFVSPMSGFPGALDALLQFATVSMLFFALYLLAVVVLYRGLGPIHQTFRLIRDVLPQRKKEKSDTTIENAISEAVGALSGNVNSQNRSS